MIAPPAEKVGDGYAVLTDDPVHQPRPLNQAEIGVSVGDAVAPLLQCVKVAYHLADVATVTAAEHGQMVDAESATVTAELAHDPAVVAESATVADAELAMVAVAEVSNRGVDADLAASSAHVAAAAAVVEADMAAVVNVAVATELPAVAAFVAGSTGFQSASAGPTAAPWLPSQMDLHIIIHSGITKGVLVSTPSLTNHNFSNTREKRSDDLVCMELHKQVAFL